MPLTEGSRLGPHRIIGLLGAGGMGEVYRAHDTRLNRHVAIKILPSEYAKDPDRLARFEREAQAVAALNHPGVAAIYDFEQAEGIGYLVLELVEGDTLADRLRRGALPPEDALNITRQIGEALEVAHERGICHRDLKPANIKLADGDRVKVLDFGLAKVLQESGGHGNLANSPTLSLAGTLPGVILGTAGYMSPEQAKGFAADHRSDIFSLGCILYELLTGRQAFEGDTASEILAGILKLEPDYSCLPARLNPRIGELLRRCLAKQPKQRWHAVADVRVEIESILAQGVFARGALEAPRAWWKRALPIGAAAVAGAALAGAGILALTPRPRPAVMRFAVALPQGQQLTFPNRHLIVLSPDGSQLAYVASGRLFVRSMDDVTPRSVAGTEAAAPVFSPDGRSLAFWTLSDRVIKRISVGGGAALTICPADTAPYGMDWTEQGIFFGDPTKGILRVSPNGGVPEIVVATKAPDETAASPQLLPGGRALLYSLAQGTAANRWDLGQIVVQTLGSAERKVVVQGGSDARYVPTGHLVYAVSGSLLAVPFDLDRMETTGSPVPVIEGVRRAAFIANVPPTAHFTSSTTGTAAYVPGPVTTSNAQADLALVDREGKATPLRLPAAPYEGPRVSPDGRFAAVSSTEGKETIVSVYELSGRSSITRLTFGGRNQFPIWSADSQWVVYQSDREGDLGIFRQRADGTGSPERLTRAENGMAHVPDAWLPKGERLLYTVGKDGRYALWSLALSDRKSAPWGNVQSTTPPQAVFSPDGKWIAYQSAETGTDEIFVQPFPDGGAKYMVPHETQNHHPLWSPDAKELFYIPRQGSSFAVPVLTNPRFAFGTPAPINRGPRVEGPPVARRNHDILPDGRFIGVISGDTSQADLSTAPQIQIVLNWFEDLKQRAR